MFHFRKREKSERKKDKDDKKRRDKSDAPVTVDELRRLEEARVSMLGTRARKKDKLPSGITADYMASFSRAEREALATRSSCTDWYSSVGGYREDGEGSGGGRRFSLRARSLADASDVSGPPRPPKRGVHRSSVSGASVRDGVINFERLIEQRSLQATSGGAAVVAAAPALFSVSSSPAAAAATSPASPPHSLNTSSRSVQQLAKRFETASPHAPSAVAAPLTTTTAVKHSRASSIAAAAGASTVPPPSISSTPSSLSDADSLRRNRCVAVDAVDRRGSWSSSSSSRCWSAVQLPLPLPPLPAAASRRVLRRVVVVSRLSTATATTISTGGAGGGGLSRWPIVVGGATDGGGGATASNNNNAADLSSRPLDVASAGSGVPLLPGDRLIAVNHTQVTQMRRQDVLRLIDSISDNQLTLTVLTAAALSELALCQSRPADVWLEQSEEEQQAAAHAPPASLSPDPGVVQDSSKFGGDSVAPLCQSAAATAGAWQPRTELVWLVHKDGFSLARVLVAASDSCDTGGAPLAAGRVLVRLHANNEVLEVDEDDLEKAGDPDDCGALVSDLSRLRHLNESSALHVLRHRYASRLVYTHAGAAATLVALNPAPHPARSSLTLGGGTGDGSAVDAGDSASQLRQLFQPNNAAKFDPACPAPPHVYASAQAMYRSALCQRRAQAVLVLGRSGAGKSHCSRQILHYLVAEATSGGGGDVTSASRAGSTVTPPALNADRLEAVFTLLQSFCHCRIAVNASASRALTVYTLQLHRSGQLSSASVQVMLLERCRVARRPEGESNFHIFHQLLAGCDDQLRNQLQLHEPLQPNSFVTPLPQVERSAAVDSWHAVLRAAHLLNIGPAECQALWSVVAAILHLGAAGVCRVPGAVDHQLQFANSEAADRAACLLGVDQHQLARAVLAADSAATLKRAVSSQQLAAACDASAPPSSASASADTAGADGCDALEAFVVGLYAHLVTALVTLINRCISPPLVHQRHTNALLVVDSPGVQSPAHCGRQTGASLDDLCFNYVQERLQLLYHELTCSNLLQNYAKEEIVLNTPADDDYSDTVVSSAALVSALDQPLTGRSDSAASSSSATPADGAAAGGGGGVGGRCGLLWLLHEAAQQPDVSDVQLLQAVDSVFTSHEDRRLVSVGPGDTCLTVHHLAGTQPVTYDVTGWVAAARESAAARRAAILLLESRRECVSVLFVSARASLGVASLSGSVAGLDSAHNQQQHQQLLLLRSSSMRRTFHCTAAAAGAAAGALSTRTLTWRHSSRPILVKQQLDALLERLRRCSLRFVHCFLPQSSSGPGSGPGTAVSTDSPTVDLPLLRSQLRGAQLLHSMRVYKHGYPEHMSFGEFNRLFSILVLPSGECTAKLSLNADPKMALLQLLNQLELDPLGYRVGLTQIFLRPSVLSDLECRREDHIRDSLVLFQSVCRSYLARKRFKHLQVQQLAISCIQRNVRLYQGVRNWSWWRLFTKIAPLLDVHRTERQLRTATEELTKLRAQLAKTEEERSSYKQERDALEGKMGEMVGELQDERHTSGMATRRLQQEQCDKQQLQRQLGDTRREFDRMCLLNEQLASELSAQNSGSGGGGRSTEFDDDDDDDGALYSRQVEHITRQLHYTQKQMQQQRDDSEEQLAAVRKQLERKLEAAVETADEQKQLVAQLKRKVARLVGEAADQKVHLDEQVARNNVLERRQRKFDSDMQTLADDLKRERLARERVCQEKDQLQSETYSLRNEVSALRLELEMCEEKAAALRRELDSTQSSDQLHATDEETPQQLRRARLELQRLCDEREEQLEDSAGQVALLEQAKLRLEMCLQQARQQHRLELTQKDDELDELRASIVKKVKALESQLELEHEERQQLVRDKHELERQLVTLGENTLCADSRHQDTEQRLRRQLKRTRALLADAQLQLDSGGGGGADGSGGAGIGKGQLRQMRNQLEDAEFAAAAATRGRLAAESELQELQLAMEEVQRAKSQAESRATGATRQVSQLQSQLDEQDDELQEVMRKYKSCVAQLSADQTTLADQNNQLEQLQLEVGQLREQLADSTARCQQLAGDSGARDDQRRLELRVRELDSRLDFEAAGKQRVERQLVRVREQLEQAGQLAAAARERELSSGESLKKLQRQLREAREELAESQRRETDSGQQLSVLSKQLEQCHAETAQSRSDLRLALKRIADLQNAMQGELESDELSNSDDSLSHSEDEIDDVDSFLSARLPSSLLLTAPSATAATSVENGSSALSPDSTCFNNNNNSSHSGSSESNNNNKTAD